jgi:hypothetical protein
MIEFLKTIEIEYYALGISIISALGTLFLKIQTIKVEANLKSRLAILENEKSIRLSRLADKQLEVMIDLYERVADLNGSLQYYSGPFDWGKLREDKQFEGLFANICNFQRAFYKSKVFLTKELEGEFGELIKIAQRTKVFYRIVMRGGNGSSHEDKFTEDMKYIHDNLPKVIDKIDKHYRKIWNIES